MAYLLHNDQATLFFKQKLNNRRQSESEFYKFKKRIVLKIKPETMWSIQEQVEKLLKNIWKTEFMCVAKH